MRRLAAIMFTDLVGYSALTQKNEALALKLLAEHREILRPLFVKHTGREIETAGDSFFVEFDSAVEATNCAIEIQKHLHNRNLEVKPDHQIRLRIGLHIGDVVYVDGHVHGDGVNIAARMEPLSPPGGICLSQDVARQVRNKLEYPVDKLGKGNLKNISMPMDIYTIRLPWLTFKNEKRTLSKKYLIYLTSIILFSALAFGFFYLGQNQNPKMKMATDNLMTRIAVLPFDNISSDDQDEYFSDGMTEELISRLSKISGLRVIARTSIMKYKGIDAFQDVLQIGKELMVGTILEGSVRKFNNKARINVNLVNVASQEQIWTMNYDRELQDIFSIQSEIAMNVADELEVRLLLNEKEQIDKNYTNNLVAYEEYLVGRAFLNEKTSQSIQKSIVHFEKSIEEDRDFVLPYASIAYAYTLISGAGYGQISKDLAHERAVEYMLRAIEMDESLPETHAVSGYIKFRLEWDWGGAEKEFQRAIDLNPSYATAHEWYALFLSVMNRYEEALEEINLACELDPLSVGVNNGKGRIYQFRGEFHLALDQFDKVIKLDSNYAEGHFGQGMTYLSIANYDKALVSLHRAVKLSGRRPIVLGFLGKTYAKMGNIGEARTLLDELEKPPVNSDKLFASCFIKYELGEEDQVYDIFEQLVPEKYGILIYLNTDIHYFDYNNVRYQKILRDMKLIN